MQCAYLFVRHALAGLNFAQPSICAGFREDQRAVVLSRRSSQLSDSHKIERLWLSQRNGRDRTGRCQIKCDMANTVEYEVSAGRLAQEGFAAGRKHWAVFDRRRKWEEALCRNVQCDESRGRSMCGTLRTMVGAVIGDAIRYGSIGPRVGGWVCGVDWYMLN